MALACTEMNLHKLYL